MDSGIELNMAKKEDLDIIEKLLKTNGLPYKDIPQKLGCVFIGRSGSKVFGIGGMEIYGKYSLLRSLVIKESFRGKGYVKALCTKLIEYARLKDVREIYLLTTTAESFFERNGFKKIYCAITPKSIQNTG